MCVMRLIISLLFGWFACLLPLISGAQHTEFRVGSAQESIEPQQNVFSLTLAGYGGPREGRFTLKWTTIGNLGDDVVDAAFVQSELFILRDGNLWTAGQRGADRPTPLSVGSGMVLLAADGKRLYGVNAQQEILSTVGRGKLQWEKTGLTPAGKQPVALTILGDNFILTDKDGDVWQADRNHGQLLWKKIGNKPGIIDLVAHSGRLYALTADGELLYHKPDGDWLRVAIRNDNNYPFDIRKVAACEGVLYGFDASGDYYKGEHFSDGNLKAGAIAVKNGKERVVIVGVDVCGFDIDFTGEVKRELSARYRLPSSAVLINASHTHYAPVTQRWPPMVEHCRQPDSLYLYSTVKDAILRAVGSAIKNEKPASLEFGRGAADLGRNRNLPGTDLPYDNAVDVIRVNYKNKDYSDLMFLAGCHPVFTADGKDFYKASANYPGVARELLVHHSKVRNPLFLQGCGGDINPLDKDHKVTASKLAGAVAEVLKKDDLSAVEGVITHFLDTVNLPTKPWSEQKLLELRAEKEKEVGDIHSEMRVRWANLMLDYYKNGNMPTELPVFIQTINIGNWKLVGLSRETTTEYSIAVKKLWPEKLVTVSGYNNDVSSYLPTRRHISTNIYEGNDSFFWYGQPSSFPENVHEVVLDAIRTKNR